MGEAPFPFIRAFSSMDPSLNLRVWGWGLHLPSAGSAHRLPGSFPSPPSFPSLPCPRPRRSRGLRPQSRSAPRPFPSTHRPFPTFLLCHHLTLKLQYDDFIQCFFRRPPVHHLSHSSTKTTEPIISCPPYQRFYFLNGGGSWPHPLLEPFLDKVALIFAESHLCPPFELVSKVRLKARHGSAFSVICPNPSPPPAPTHHSLERGADPAPDNRDAARAAPPDTAASRGRR